MIVSVNAINVIIFCHCHCHHHVIIPCARTPYNKGRESCGNSCLPVPSPWTHPLPGTRADPSTAGASTVTKATVGTATSQSRPLLPASTAKDEARTSDTAQVVMRVSRGTHVVWKSSDCHVCTPVHVLGWVWVWVCTYMCVCAYVCLCMNVCVLVFASSSSFLIRCGPVQGQQGRSCGQI